MAEGKRNVNVARVVLLLLILLSVGCSYKTHVDLVTDVTVYSAYDSKIPGKYALITSADSAMLDVTIRSQSYTGSALDFPIMLTSSFIASVRDTNEHLFDEIVETAVVPDIGQMEQDGFSGYILISSKLFEPRVQFNPGFWSSTVTATVNLGFDYVIRNASNEIMLTGAVSEERTSYMDAGTFGDNASLTIKDAVEKALREALERYAERVANSPKLREAAKPRAKVRKP